MKKINKQSVHQLANSFLLSLGKKYKSLFSDKGFLVSFSGSFLLLATSLIINFYAGTFATEKASNPVTDLILDHIPVFDVDGIFVYGALVFWAFVVFLCGIEPKRILFVVKSAALFVLIRSVFISLTHLGPFPTHLAVSSDLFSKITFAGDLFFSGHTGLPFLMALLFWNNKKLRYFFIAASIIFGTVVLMAHLHYSIDVLAAFFITYSIYRLAEIFFKKDQKLFLS